MARPRKNKTLTPFPVASPAYVSCEIVWDMFFTATTQESLDNKMQTVKDAFTTFSNYLKTEKISNDLVLNIKQPWKRS